MWYSAVESGSWAMVMLGALLRVLGQHGVLDLFKVGDCLAVGLGQAPIPSLQ